MPAVALIAAAATRDAALTAAGRNIGPCGKLGPHNELPNNIAMAR
jgi:hypothetical protein